MKPQIFAFACLSSLFAHLASAQEPMSRYEGLWSGQQSIGSSLSGEIEVQRRGENWNATLATKRVSAAKPEFDFGDDGGRLIVGDSVAWWMQPPGLPGQGYATPVRLLKSGPNEWRGQVQSLLQSFTLHVKFFADEKGQWSAAVRNKEFNMNGGVSRFRANTADQRVLLVSPNGETTRTFNVLHEPQRLRVEWPPLPNAVELQKDSQINGYLPREPQDYSYRRPLRTGDGWQTQRARRQGFDEAALDALVQGIIDGDPAAERPNLIHSLLVVRRGRLVLEEYFHGYSRDVPHDLRSAGKTLASVLVGASIHEGAEIAANTRLANAIRIPESAKGDARKSRITLAHLMTHTSGLACNDYDDDSPGREGAMQGQSDQKDWHRFALDLPMVHEPGERYAYCSAGINLVGAALTAKTGESVVDLFDRQIARPLNFGLYHWNLMPNGEGYLGGGVHLRPRDLAKIGQVYLNGGVWRGRRILDQDWVNQSTAAHIEINEAITGLSSERFADVAIRGADGLAWHRYGVRFGDRRVESYEASGNGGQLLIVVPEYELVVVMTGGNYGQGGIWNRWRDDVVGGQILAALKK